MGDIGIFMEGHGGTQSSAAMETADADLRVKMTDFWVEHSQDASLQEMMLDTNAEELTKHELPEILSYLPSWERKDILELGAGIGVENSAGSVQIARYVQSELFLHCFQRPSVIGIYGVKGYTKILHLRRRFTGELAASARSVIAVDFMEKFINKNKENNAQYDNIQYQCKDVTKLNVANNSCDIIFSNWLMMYLEDTEVQNLIRNELSWLREGGYLFARESCFRQSGNKKRGENPTKYRDPALYMAMFTMLTVPTDNPDEVFGFELVLSRPVKSYITMKQNENQVVWLLQKLRRKSNNDNGYTTFQEFLDNQQYSNTGILRYEKIFGRTFISTGGLDTTKDFVSRLNLQPGQIVLDVGCGIGGSAFYMVKEFGAKVIAIDLSSNMVNIGLKRAKEVGINEEEVQFEVADATKREYRPETFDIVYSRDTILHIPDKLALFQKFYKWLKPGGKLLISDYCCSDGEHSEHFKTYVKQRGYNLLSPRSYGEVLEAAGFSNVDAQDRTDLFVESLEKELVNTESMREEFVQEFSQEDYDYIVRGWKDKLNRTTDQRWGVFYAEKH